MINKLFVISLLFTLFSVNLNAFEGKRVVGENHLDKKVEKMQRYKENYTLKSLKKDIPNKKIEAVKLTTKNKVDNLILSKKNLKESKKKHQKKEKKF